MISSKKRLICKRLKTFRTENSEFICLKLTICNKKWLCFSVYRSPSQEVWELSFVELTCSLGKASESYKNFVDMGEFKTDNKAKGREFGKSEILAIFAIFQI